MPKLGTECPWKLVMLFLLLQCVFENINNKRFLFSEYITTLKITKFVLGETFDIYIDNLYIFSHLHKKIIKALLVTLTAYREFLTSNNQNDPNTHKSIEEST